MTSPSWKSKDKNITAGLYIAHSTSQLYSSLGQIRSVFVSLEVHSQYQIRCAHDQSRGKKSGHEAAFSNHAVKESLGFLTLGDDVPAGPML
jgi:hypothetical protein